MKPHYRNLLIGVATALLAACGGGGGGNNASAPPTAQASASQTTVAMGDTITLDGSASTGGAGGGALSYQWTLAGRPANSVATLSSTTAARPTLVADKPGTYTADLIVSDSGASSAPARVVITVTSPYPVASTAGEISVQLGTETVGLDGTASTPPTGQTGALSYRWTLKSKPESSASTILDWDKGNATLTTDVEGEYRIELIVSHDGVDSEPALVTVTVTAGNAPPVAAADPVTVKLGETVRLDASKSYDPEAQPLQYRWRFRPATGSDTGAPVYVTIPTLDGASTATPSFTPPAVGDYYLTLYVFDGLWKSSDVLVKVTVEKPDASAGNKPLVGKLVATGYYPSSSVGEQEVGGRANVVFEGYDPEGEAVQFVSAELLSKPAGSTAFLEEMFPGLGYPYMRKIQKLDLAGEYKLRMVVSDGVNPLTVETTMRARIGGINNRPLSGTIAPLAASVLVNQPIIFQAGTGTRDPDGDPLTYEWTLVHKPDGSNAVIEAMIEPDSNEYRRGRVIADRPGVYIARLQVVDDRGLRGADYAESQAMAKVSNNAPVIRRVAYTTQYIQLSDAQPYQLLPCMRLVFKPVLVDPDGDLLYTNRELISNPAGGSYGNNSSKGCTSTDSTFNEPGEYVFRYLVSDGIAETPYYDFKVVVQPMSEARGVVLEEIGGTVAKPTSLLQPWPYAYQVPTNHGSGSSTPATAPQTIKTFNLKAADGSYTIVDLKGEHINGDSLTPYFEGIVEGQVIAPGETVQIKLTNPPFNCLRNEDTLYEGFRWSFRVQEIPEATFVHETWRSAILNNGATPWPSCGAR